MADARRPYDSPVRRQRTEETRARIVDAGAAILHEHALWDWDELTVRAVAARADVSERTVYRHFGSEHGLRDAVLARLEEESGTDLDTLGLDDLQGFAAGLLTYISRFPLQARTPLDPTLVGAGERKRAALRAAIAEARPGWSASEQIAAAAAIDVLWSVGTYERLITEWELDGDDARAAVIWAISLVEGEIRADRPPPGGC